MRQLGLQQGQAVRDAGLQSSRGLCWFVWGCCQLLGCDLIVMVSQANSCLLLTGECCTPFLTPQHGMLPVYSLVPTQVLISPKWASYAMGANPQQENSLLLRAFLAIVSRAHGTHPLSSIWVLCQLNFGSSFPVIACPPLPQSPYLLHLLFS